MLGWPSPQRGVFRTLLVNPQLVWYLNQIIGHGFRLDQAPRLLGSGEGEIGRPLPGGDETRNPSRAYYIQNGRRSCQALKAIWVLENVEENDGGFAAVPGSHKTHYSMPPCIRTCDDQMGLVVQPVMKAGDVLFFMDGGMTHSALAWRNPVPLRGVLIKYQSKNSNLGGGVIDPKDHWGDMVEDMTEEQFAVMRGPERDARDRTIPRLVVKDGKVCASYDPEDDKYAAATENPGRPKSQSKRDA